MNEHFTREQLREEWVIEKPERLPDGDYYHGDGMGKVLKSDRYPTGGSVVKDNRFQHAVDYYNAGWRDFEHRKYFCYHPANQATLDACITEGAVKPIEQIIKVTNEEGEKVGDLIVNKDPYQSEFKPVEQVEQNEMEKMLNTQFAHDREVLKIYNKLLAEKKELERKLEKVNKTNCDLFDDLSKAQIELSEKPAFEMDLSNALLLNDFSEEERQQVKDYAQKLKDERVATDCYYLIEDKGNDSRYVGFLTKFQGKLEWYSAPNHSYIQDFDTANIIERLYTAEELEDK